MARDIEVPQFWCVMTMDGRSIDRMIAPFLGRLRVAGIMMSMFYAQRLRGRPVAGLPLFVDSGGFALIARGGRIERCGDTWEMVTETSEEAQGLGGRLTPAGVLELQQSIADVGATLDAPIPPGTQRAETRRRMEMTLANAAWAASAPRREGFRLYASVQGASVEDFGVCAKALDGLAIDGMAIGGLVPRMKDREEVLAIAEAVRSATDKPLHAFGVGHPQMVGELMNRGVVSMDSSSPIRAAASGLSWRRGTTEMPSPMERLRAAVENLADLTGAYVNAQRLHE